MPNKQDIKLPRTLQRSPKEAQRKGEIFGGVEVLGHTRQELLDRAERLQIHGRSRMTKEELGRAISKKQG